MAFNIVATADLHLGRTSSRLPAGRRHRMGATTAILDQIIDTAVRQQADAVAIAGDVIDATNDFVEVYNHLVNLITTLADHNIHLLLTAGNHDHSSLPEFIHHLDDSVPQDHLHFLGGGAEWSGTILENAAGERVQILGWSFDAPTDRRNPLDRFSADQIDTNHSTIGILHGDAYDNDSPYAPIQTDQLGNLPIDGWILGHIHKPEIIQSSHPFLAYPGSPQPLSPKETGAHSVLIVEVEPDGTIEYRREELSPLRYLEHSISIDKELEADRLRSHCMQKLSELKTETELTLLELSLKGRSPHQQQLQELADELQKFELRDDLYIHTVHMQVQPAIEHLEQLARLDDPVGLLAGSLLDLQKGETNPFIKSYREKLQQLRVDIDNSKTYQVLQQVGLEENTGGDDPGEEIDHLLEDQLWDTLYRLHQQKMESSDAA